MLDLVKNPKTGFLRTRLICSSASYFCEENGTVSVRRRMVRCLYKVKGVICCMLVTTVIVLKLLENIFVQK